MAWTRKPKARTWPSEGGGSSARAPRKRPRGSRSNKTAGAHHGVSLLGILVSLSALWAQGTGFFGFKFFFDFVAGVMPSGLLNVFQKVDQLIVYVVAISVLLLRPRGLMGRKGIMED